MAAANDSKDFAAGALGGDLPPVERDAFQHGHDADTPAIGELPQHPRSQTSTESAATRASDFEKGNSHPRSEASSINGDEAITNRDPEKVQVEATATEQNDPNIVFWDGPDDPQNPLNWTARKKWSNIAVISALTFLSPLASSFFAPAVPQLMKDFNSDSQTLATFVVSIYVLGFAFGPLIVAPASELYGRVIVYNISNVGFIAFTVACAVAQDLTSLHIFRFLEGVWGVTAVTIGGGTIADLMVPEKRGAAMAIWAMGPLFGPVAGPVAGGFLSQAKDWRWIFWVIVMASGVASIASLLFLRETYAPVLLERKTKRLQKETGNMELRSKLDSGLTPKEHFQRAIVRPTKMLFLSPICAAMCVYMAVIYAFLYLLFTTFTYVFEQNYGFSSSIVGLVYLGLGIGNFVGLAVLGVASDRIMNGLAARRGGAIRPEDRLPLLMVFGPFVPVGLFIYGWAAQEHVQWAVPVIGTGIVGIGMIGTFMCVNTYLVDAFSIYAASAMAANTILRSLFGGLFPLFGLKMYDALGLGWGNSLLGFLGLALCPIPFLFYAYGERIRTNPRFQLKF